MNLNAVVWWRKSVMWCIDVEYIDYKAAAVYPIVCPSSVIIIILHDICFIMFHLHGKSSNSHLQILVVFNVVNDQQLLFLGNLKDLIVSSNIAWNYLLISRVKPATLVITCETMLPNSNHYYHRYNYTKWLFFIITIYNYGQ